MKHKFDLKKYQDFAVNSITKHLIQQFSMASVLKSPTGSGKTIMATSILERFANHHHKAKTVVIWVSEDQNLNEQSKQKIINSSDVYFEDDCEQVQYQNFTKFNNGKIYFLNYQKLGSEAHLSKGTERMSGKSLWERFEDLNRSASHIILIIDEAHKGTTTAKKGTVDKSKTIIKKILEKLSNACVLAISATPKNSSEALSEANFDVALTEVDKKDVVDAKMIKSKITLNFTEKKEDLNYDLISSAVSEYDSIASKWQREGIEEPPLMLVQIANKFDENTVAFDELITYLQESKKCRKDAIFHSLPGYSDITINKGRESEFSIKHIDSNDIPYNNKVKFVIFKETLSEGWDCPRAEILLSLKSKNSESAIEQTVGRLLRNFFLNKPHILTSSPELNNVPIYTNGYNKGTLELIQKGFSGDVAENNIDENTLRRVTIKDEVEDFFSHISINHHFSEAVENLKTTYTGQITKVAYKIDDTEGDDFDDFIEETEEALAEYVLSLLNKYLTPSDVLAIKSTEIGTQEADILSAISDVSLHTKDGREIHISYIESKLKNLRIDPWLIDGLSDEFSSLSNFNPDLLSALDELNIFKNPKNVVISLLYALSIHSKMDSLETDIEKFINKLYEKNNLKEKTPPRKIKKGVFLPDISGHIDTKTPKFTSLSNFGEKGTYNLVSGKSVYEKCKTSKDVHESIQEFKIDSQMEAVVLDKLLSDDSVKYILRNDPRKGFGIKYKDHSNNNRIFYPDFLALTEDKLQIIEPKSIKIDDNFSHKYRATLDWLDDHSHLDIDVEAIWYIQIKKQIFKVDIEKERSMLDSMRSEQVWLDGKIGEKIGNI